MFRLPKIVVVVLWLYVCAIVVSAFQVPQSRPSGKYFSTVLQSKSFGDDRAAGEEFDDGIGNGNSSNPTSDGEDLAKEFFRQQREREQRRQQRGTQDSFQGSDSNNPPKNDNTSDTPVRIDRNRSLFDEPAGSGGESSNNDDNSPRRKFTGRREDQMPQSFGGSRGGQARSPREIMMEREYELVGRAERGLGIQAIFTVLALAFCVYIGASGGIVSGDAALSDDFGGDDAIYFEETMPVQRDSENSVWL